MKVLFAVNNDNISDAIIKKYQKEYKEIISYKNVYYFNAILKELQNDKAYDRIVISEDLEPFANNNYDTIDKFIFEKLDKISDEATKANGDNIDIILICTDRRNKSDEMLTKFFGIGIYNALLGNERNIDNLCKLLNHPRTKKEAKSSYKIEGNQISYQAEDENNVSEAEVQNILAHYKRLGKDEDKYVDSFNNIVSQYSDAQLKIIIRYLPLHVKAILEERSPKYQELVTFSQNGNEKNTPLKPTKKEQKTDKIKVKMLKEEKDNITRPIVIPSALNKKRILSKPKEMEDTKMTKVEHIVEEDNETVTNPKEVIVEKKGRGRPRKHIEIANEQEDKPKRGRGRPKKVVESNNVDDDDDDDLDLLDFPNDENILTESNNVNKDDLDLFSLDEEEQEDNDIDLFALDDEENTDKNDLDLFSLDDDEEEIPNEDNIDLLKPQEETENEDDVNLFGLDEEETSEEDDIDLFGLDEEETLNDDNTDNHLDDDENETDSIVNNNMENEIPKENDTDFNTSVVSSENQNVDQDYNSVFTRDKKIVIFVGTTKNGTSFIVNNLAQVLSSRNISTAVLDTTQSKNAYYIYTNNEQNLRNIAEESITKLSNGITEGISVNKNLEVFTELPGKPIDNMNVEKILNTLTNKYDVVLIDADFNTPLDYFEMAHEIYLVQSMDILTIQPLTAFLRDLKSKKVLKQEKLKIIINKELKVNSLSDKVLIGGISSYNDPSMSYMTDLFDRDKIVYCKIPFEIQNYSKYLSGLVNCEISFHGYTKQFINALNELAEIVYPLVSNQKESKADKKKKRMEFSNTTKDTLNKMKKKY